MLALGLITMLGLGLRVMAVGLHSFWYDEAVTAQLTQRSLYDLFIGHAKDNGNLPLYWLLARVWGVVFGRSEVAFRSLSVVCGVATVPLLGVLGRRLVSPLVGLLAAGLLAISPTAVELSNEARTYALLMLLAVVSTWLFARWLEQRRGLDLVLYGLTTFLTCYSHYYAFALPLAHGAALLSVASYRRLLVPWACAMVVAGLLWAYWIPAFFEQLRTPGNLSRGGEHWQVQFAATPVVFGLGRTFAWRDSSRALLAFAVVAAVVVFWVPAVWGVTRLWRRRPLAAVLLAAWWLIPILGPLVVAVLWKPIYHTRYASLGLPAFVLLVGVGLEGVGPALRYTVIGLVVALTGVSLFRYGTEPQKDDWRSATPIIMAQAKPDEPVVFDTDYEVTTFKYYAAGFDAPPAQMIGLMSGPSKDGALEGVKYRNGQQIDRVSRDYKAELFSAPGVWLVLCVPKGSPAEYESLFEGHGYKLRRHDQFHRIDLYHFTK
jgi:mannosyltransferase